jgi:alcohol dehydrogenase (cytochrome c)
MRNFAVFLLALAGTLTAQSPPDPGRMTFERSCGKCHGADGKGGEMAPAIIFRLTARNDAELAALIRAGLPDRGMPPVRLTDDEMPALVRFLRSIQKADRPLERRKITTSDGKSLDGEVLTEGFDDLQLRTNDGRVRLFRRDHERFREVTSQQNWPGYDGDPRGNRYTAMTQINKSNVARLAPQWVVNIPSKGPLQGTPVVAGGIMYVTTANECYALDAGNGRQIWHFKRATTRGYTEANGGATNRGAAVAGDRVFMDTDEAHIVALNRYTGELLWETVIADWHDNYFTTSAPQVAGDFVLSGVAGGEHGANGFVAAFDQATGNEVWRFWTVPRPGEPGSETWQGIDITHGGAPTWFIGTYDPELDVVYWPAGNPSKEYNGDQRGGDNLYSDSVLALDRKTGKLLWHYQFTPHDLWDWDATETSVLIDADWQGRQRKLLLHADRNGFFYVFDRSNGKLLLWKPFVKKLTWASGIDADGRPIKNPDQEPSKQGTLVCPSQDGATNWFSPSYNPATGLYYVQTFEKCSVYTKRDGEVWESGKSYLGGSQRTADELQPQRVLKAIDIRSGAIQWELPQPGPAYSWGGTLSTAGGLVIFAEEGGALMAADAASGKPLWSFPANASWRASPMTYMFDGKQYIAIATGADIIAFGIQE